MDLNAEEDREVAARSRATRLANMMFRSYRTANGAAKAMKARSKVDLFWPIHWLLNTGHDYCLT